jgi:hypothetical protein
VNAPEQPRIRELAQVTPDRIRRDVEGQRQLRSDDLAITSQPFEDCLPPLFVQHELIQAQTCSTAHIYCVFLRFSALFLFEAVRHLDPFEPVTFCVQRQTFSSSGCRVSSHAGM